MRKFEDRQAAREKTPILIGLVGPSGSGKTFSALRLATGFQRVSGGETFVIDTEARRSLHYAEKFKFRHVAFGAPFSPLDYLDAINYCVEKGATTIVIDSMSHEHEGPGGVLEMHEAELNRRAGNDYKKRERVTMIAWAKPKAERRRLINSILQIPCNFIFCFRAKEKLRIVKGEEPLPLGFQPIAGDEFVYEMTAKFLLLPGANGVPTLSSSFVGEQATIKLPDQFRPWFSGQQAPQFSEDLGERLARWGAGGEVSSATTRPQVTAEELIRRADACSDPATLRTLIEDQRTAWSTLSKEDRPKIKAAFLAAEKRIQEAAKAPDESMPGDDADDAPFDGGRGDGEANRASEGNAA